MIKTYYLLRLTQRSPLRISSGEGERADSDLKRDSRGFPYIPGSSLAGVLRGMLPVRDGDRLFGALGEGESRVIVSDAVLRCAERDFSVTVRDGVGLDDGGVAEEGKKYDFEVLECAKPYHAVLEADGDAPEMDLLLREISAEGGLLVGGRTTRGYGRLAAEIRRKRFDFPRDLKAWLDWDPFGEDAWDDCEETDGDAAPSARRTVVSADIAVQGSFSIRSFAGEDGLDATFLSDRDGNPVIPGTSWAGVFRHHMRALAAEMGMDEGLLGEIDLFFGKREESEGFLRSSVLFSETVITGSRSYRWTRVGVDRFTAAPGNGKLFTNEYCEGGVGVLTLEFPREYKDGRLEQLLACCLMDLHRGILHIGGEGSVGRGRVKITALAVDGTDRTEEMEKGILTLKGREVCEG